MATAIQKPPAILLRGIDPGLWHQVRVAATDRRQTHGELVNAILREWVARQKPGAPS